MKVSIIVAMTDQRVIGINNELPWKLSGDMAWFRQQTMGKPIIMGRKTYESIGRPLPGRANIIITRDRSYCVEKCAVAHDIDDALRLAGDVDEAMIIGGASFYEQMLPQADRLYLTLVHGEVEGDAWFPEIDFDQWQEIERHDHLADEKNQFDHSFLIFERRTAQTQ